MRFNKKLIFKIIAVIVIALIVISIFLLFYYKKINSKDSNQKISDNIVHNNNNGNGFPENNNNINNNTNNNFNHNINIEETPLPEVELKSIAIIIAERIGSYSTDTQNFANLDNIDSLMTDKMKKWLNNLKNINDNKNSEYYGVTTKALSVKIVDIATLENGVAGVIVICQRTETKDKDNPVSKIKYQNLKMQLVKINEKWFADSIEWE